MTFFNLFSQYFSNNAYQKGKSSLLAIISYFTIIVALFIDATVFGIELSQNQIFGILIVVFFNFSAVLSKLYFDEDEKKEVSEDKVVSEEKDDDFGK